MRTDAEGAVPLLRRAPGLGSPPGRFRWRRPGAGGQGRRTEVDHLSRLGSPSALGLDETAFLAANAQHSTLLVTGFVDLDRHRLVDVVEDRSAAAVSTWLRAKPKVWRDGIATVAIDPYRGCARGVADALPDADLVVDPFHAVRLADAALDEVRRRVQQETLGDRGRQGDPLYTSADCCWWPTNG